MVLAVFLMFLLSAVAARLVFAAAKAVLNKQQPNNLARVAFHAAVRKQKQQND